MYRYKIYYTLDVLRKIPTIIGKEEKHILDIEKEVAQKLRYWEK